MTRQSYDRPVISYLKISTEVLMPKSTFFNLPADKQEKIIRDSITEFAGKGYDKGNIGEIATNSNVAKGSMYQYFDGKRDLYIFTVKQALEISMSGIRYVFDDLRQENIFDFMYKGFKAAWPLLEKERDVFLLLRSVRLEADSTGKNELLNIITASSEELFTKIIEENKSKGLIRKDISTRLLVIYINGISAAFKSHMLDLAVSNGRDVVDTEFADNEKIITDMIDLIKNGITTKV